MRSRAFSEASRTARRRRQGLSDSLMLFPDRLGKPTFPTTRYAGSKLKLLDWIWTSVEGLEFDSVLDLFGGTGSVSYLIKTKGKQVTFNDNLRSNYLIGKALIENSAVMLSEKDMSYVLSRHTELKYRDFIERTFKGIFFLDDENRWLDVVAQNILRLRDPYKQAMAYFALFQACIAKRPYNLFHRANLYMRTARVARSFGNKTTWDTPFDEHFDRAVREGNEAVFDNGRQNRALCKDALEVEGDFDLVYIDPPYMNRRGVGVDYLEFYHFLEGLTEYNRWPERITMRYKHRPYAHSRSPWCDPSRIHKVFDEVVDRFSKSILVVSYRDNGIPTPNEIVALLKRHRRLVREANNIAYKYVLSTAGSQELLFIGE